MVKNPPARERGSGIRVGSQSMDESKFPCSDSARDWYRRRRRRRRRRFLEAAGSSNCRLQQDKPRWNWRRRVQFFVSFMAIAQKSPPPPLSTQTTSPRNLACPTCLEPLSRHGPQGFNRAAIAKSILRCQTCSKDFPSDGTFIDLTLGANRSTWQETLPIGVRLFRTKWISLIYEENWRKSFEKFGFPGPDREVELAETFLQTAVDPSRPDEENLLVDISCGTGLHSRRFAKSATFTAVVAADFSEAMLIQCHALLNEKQSPWNEKVVLVRADASRLPFASGSISAVYSGAALHCWESPSIAIAEICRVLRPGGVLVATTFLPRWKSKLQTTQKFMRLAAEKIFGTKIFFFEDELDELFETSGLVSYQKIKIDSYIMVCARKKQVPASNYGVK
ncbi:uncharacterized methyltransferase At2g41040, chloroplastic [Selaginella moellendorffii]|uniref:uncharacterized methyltransferase At2g41040, chloroplastic n=1 Tax=Selaginella moellendorffii TaxID=88036 RepID=UPI000D1CAA1F|nr:uncharacterized methyltransferase At2g41040, chloroplastic [Selaginella moellendorffii]|eukprot:XP_024529180.1 uncharacterized methyltransferase At2g41040, chloroplastic [Selaginella moellendorffii]